MGGVQSTVLLQQFDKKDCSTSLSLVLLFDLLDCLNTWPKHGSHRVAFSAVDVTLDE